jgi:hypothetical protein
MSDGPRSDGFLSSRAVFGLCVVVFGLCLTAANLGWTPIYRVWECWPLALAAVGLAKMADRSAGNRWFGALLVAVGIWWTADNVYVLRFHFWQWWPLALVAAGVLMVLRSREQTRDLPPMPGSGATAAGAEAFGSARTGSPEDASAGVSGGDETITAFAFWSGSRRRSTSQRFGRADVVAIMGGVELDLRQASTATGEAVLDVFVMWGSVRVKVPPDWTVVNQVVPIMGGSDDRTSGTGAARHRLRVRGVVLMGGVDIRS